MSDDLPWGPSWQEEVGKHCRWIHTTKDDKEGRASVKCDVCRVLLSDDEDLATGLWHELEVYVDGPWEHWPRQQNPGGAALVGGLWYDDSNIRLHLSKPNLRRIVRDAPAGSVGQS